MKNNIEERLRQAKEVLKYLIKAEKNQHGDPVMLKNQIEATRKSIQELELKLNKENENV